MQMLEILGDALIPGLRRTVSDMVGSRSGGGGSGSVKPAVASPPPLSVVPPSAPVEEPSKDKPSGSGSPMSFFVKKS